MIQWFTIQPSVIYAGIQEWINISKSMIVKQYIKRWALAGVAQCGLSAGLWTKGSPVRFPVRAHAWVVGRVPSRGRLRGTRSTYQSPIDVCLSLSFSLPSPVRINKNFFKKKRWRGEIKESISILSEKAYINI